MCPQGQPEKLTPQETRALVDEGGLPVGGGFFRKMPTAHDNIMAGFLAESMAERKRERDAKDIESGRANKSRRIAPGAIMPEDSSAASFLCQAENQGENDAGKVGEHADTTAYGATSTGDVDSAFSLYNSHNLEMDQARRQLHEAAPKLKNGKSMLIAPLGSSSTTIDSVDEYESEDIAEGDTDYETDGAMEDDMGELQSRQDVLDGTMTCRLMEHQKIALSWMIKKEQSDNHGGILADDMGLGKTISTLALIITNPPPYQAYSTFPRKTTLIVAPKSLAKQWFNEVQEKCAKQLKTYLYHSDKDTPSWEFLMTHDIVITTYGKLQSEGSKMLKDGNDDAEARDSTQWRLLHAKSRWYRVILDEAQEIKNKSTITHKSCCKLDATYRWSLTGTPMQNKVEEYGSQLKWLRIKPYNDPAEFKAKFGELWAKECNPPRYQTLMTQLRDVITSTTFRRTKNSKLDGKRIVKLPRVTENITYAVFSEEEAGHYKSMQDRTNALWVKLQQRQREGGGGLNAAALQLLGILRQATLHPLLAYGLDGHVSSGNSLDDADLILLASDFGDGIYDKAMMELVKLKGVSKQSKANMDNYKRGLRQHLVPSSKITKCIDLIQDARKKGEKTIVFSSFTAFLYLIEAALAQQNIGSQYLDGAMNIPQREAAVQKFSQNVDYPVFLVSLKTGNAGLNLVAASNIIIMDPYWNPATEMQAVARAHRLGQQKKVAVHRIIVDDTVEKRIMEIQAKKLSTIEDALNENAGPNGRAKKTNSTNLSYMMTGRNRS